MYRKIKFSIASLFISFLWWINSYYLSLSAWYHHAPYSIASSIHIAIFSLVMLIGIILFRNEERWLKQVWTLTYGAIIFLALFAWFSVRGLHLFDESFIVNIGLLRKFFCGPIPLIGLYILSGIKNEKAVISSN